jgi:hypothetical protein
MDVMSAELQYRGGWKLRLFTHITALPFLKECQGLNIRNAQHNVYWLVHLIGLPYGSDNSSHQLMKYCNNRH